MSDLRFKWDDSALPGSFCGADPIEEQDGQHSNSGDASQNCSRQLLEPAYTSEELEAEDERRIANQMFAQKVKMEGKMKPLYHFLRGDFAEIPFGQHVNAYDAEKLEAVMLKNCGKLFESEKEFVFEEARLLSKFPSHKNIILLKAIATDSTNVYAVLESAKKDLLTTMETMRVDGKRFTTNEVKEIMKQLLRGVIHLHDNRIVHRNLKPSNILIGPDGTPKISDFGYARDMVGPRNCAVMLPNFHIPGHEQYAATEEISLGMYCYFGDIWSIGCILAELVLFNPLFRPGNNDFIEQQIFRFIGRPNEHEWPEFSHRKRSIPWCKGFLYKKFFSTGLLTNFGTQLLSGLLRANPRDRFQADQALFHPWFREQDDAASLAINLNNIKLRESGDMDTGESEVNFSNQIEAESSHDTERP